MEIELRVAILGGGIAGLSAAIALARIGFAAEVYERRASVHNLGAGIVCWPNASSVLREFGLLDEVQSVAGNVSVMRRLSADGTELGCLDIGRLNSTMKAPSLSILRSDLMRILVHRAEQLRVPIHLGACAVGIETDKQQRSRVRFEDGTIIEPNIVLGAEGRMKSIMREFVTGSNTPVFQGFANWIGVFESDNYVFEDLAISDYWGVGARFGIVPVSARIAYWAGGVAVQDESASCVADCQSELHHLFHDWAAPVRRIVASVSNANTRKLLLFDHDPIQVWHRDNVLLIGDAAHAALPTSGQGAAQALEDAWWLARLFETVTGDVHDVVTAFTRTRMKKTAGIALGARAFARSLFSTDADFCRDRDLKAEHADYEAMADGMATGWSKSLPISE